VGAIGAALDPYLGSDVGGTFEERRELYTDRERSRLARGREKFPVATTAAEVAGAIPTAVAIPYGAVGKVAQTGGVGARAIASGAIGATEGAAYGAASDDENRVRGAVVGGAIGGPVGALAPVVGAGVRTVGNKLFPNKVGAAAKQAGMTKDTYKTILEAAEADDILDAAGVQRVQAAGPDAMLADAGPSAKMLLDTAIQSSGKAAKVAKKAIDVRLKKASTSLTQALDDTLGKPRGYTKRAREIARATSAAREAAYKEAYDQPIYYNSPLGREVENVVGTIHPSLMGKAIKQADIDMLADGHPQQQWMATIAEDGSATLTKMPGVIQLDYIKRALGKMGAQTDAFGRIAPDALTPKKLAARLRVALGKAVPEYDKAVKMGGDKIERDQALELGYGLLTDRVRAEDVASALETMTPAARSEVLRGLRQHIDDTVAKVKRTMMDADTDARETAAAIKNLSSRANRQKISLVVGDEAADALFKDIDQSAAAFDLKAAVIENSKTHVRGVIQGRQKARLEDGPVNALRHGQSVGTVKSAAASAMGRSEAAKGRIADQMNVDLAETLTGAPDAAQQLQALQASVGNVGGGVAPGRLAELLMQRNAGFTGPQYGPR